MTHVRRMAAALFTLVVSLLLSTGAAAADIDAALQYVPSDAFVVVTLRADQARSTVLFTDSIALLMADKDAKREIGDLVKETGFDPAKHVDGLVVAGLDAKDNDDEVVAIGEVSSIDEAKIVAFAQKKGATVETKNGPGGSYYLFDGDTAVAFRGKHVIVSGPETILKALKKKGPKPVLKQALAQSQQRTIAFAVEPNAKMRKQWERENKDLATTKLMHGGIDLQNGVDASVIAKLGGAAAAKKLADFINTAIAEAKQSREVQSLGLAQILGKVVVAAKGADLTASLALSNDEVRSVINTVKRLLALR
jgi:hypothetical protein